MYNQSKVGINPPTTTKRPEFPIVERGKNKEKEKQRMVELVKWLQSERYLTNNKSDTMAEKFEKEHQWELSRNRMIDKTIQKIVELMVD